MRNKVLSAAFVLVLNVPLCAGSDRKAILWQVPGDITLHDWIWGPGGETRAPKPPFDFIEEDFKGTNPKIKVRDTKGDQWIVKFGEESHGDVFAARLLYALGYVAKPSYFVSSGIIEGSHDLRRAKPFITRDGTFTCARFKLDDHKMFAHVVGKTWSWVNNPFLGTQELNGLKILIMLTSNWDTKDARDGEGSNTAVYSKPGSTPGELYYVSEDWGASMGKWGGFFERDKWDPAGYQQESKDYARVSPSGTIEWGYRGKHVKDITSGISGGDIRWLLIYLSRVTDEQLRAGLRSSGAAESDIEIYTTSIRERIAQLQSIAEAPAAPVKTTSLGSRPPAALFLAGPSDLRIPR